MDTGGGRGNLCYKLYYGNDFIIIKNSPICTENHQEIHCFKPKTAIEVSPYMEAAAKKELARMIDAGMIEDIDHYMENLLR